MKTNVFFVYIPGKAAEVFPEFVLKRHFRDMMSKKNIRDWEVIDLDYLGKEAANKVANSDWEYDSEVTDFGRGFHHLKDHINIYLYEHYFIMDSVLSKIQEDEDKAVLMVSSIKEPLYDMMADQRVKEGSVEVFSIAITDDDKDCWVDREKGKVFDYILDWSKTDKTLHLFDDILEEVLDDLNAPMPGDRYIKSGFLGIPAEPVVGEIRYEIMDNTVDHEVMTYTPANWMIITKDWSSIEPPWCYGKIAID